MDRKLFKVYWPRGVMPLAQKQLAHVKEHYNTSRKESSQALGDERFFVGDNVKAEYDMWSWIYQEIANLRMEVSRLGFMVRINSESSPGYLNPYHAHIYSLLIPVSVIVPYDLWQKIETDWLNAKRAINEFHRMRRAVPGKKVPFELIQQLDKLHRIALLLAQKAGLGIKMTMSQDIDQSIENAITARNA